MLQCLEDVIATLKNRGPQTTSLILLNYFENKKTIHIAADMKTSRSVSCGDTTAFWIPAWQGWKHVENVGDLIIVKPLWSGLQFQLQLTIAGKSRLDIWMMNDDSHDIPQPQRMAVLGCWCEKAHLGDNMWECGWLQWLQWLQFQISWISSRHQKALLFSWNMSPDVFMTHGWNMLKLASRLCHCLKQVASCGSRAHKNYVSAAGVSLR